MPKRNLLLAVIATAAIGAIGAIWLATQPDPTPPKAATTIRYSPFVVHVKGEAPFHTISFKDVGLADLPDDRSAAWEVVAESVRYELASFENPRLMSEVAFDEAITDPSNHLACTSQHIYVDLWHPAASDRWGYSLWSGCGEEDNFAWREVHIEPNASWDDASEGLAAHIAADLQKAMDTGCFRRSC